MGKETIICIVIVILIVVGEKFVHSYTIESIEELSNNLTQLKSEIFKNEENIDMDYIKDELSQIEEGWRQRHDKLAYFIEHDELEKVETDMTSMKSFIETQEYNEAISELDKSIFVLKHIEDKYAFNLQNIF